MTNTLFRFTLLTLLVGVATASVWQATPAIAQRKTARSAPAQKATGKSESKGQAQAVVCSPSEPASTEFTIQEVDAAALAKLLPQAGQKARPVLVNFWATWCVPCREEFPDLVKIDGEFRKRGLNFFTVSLDDPAEIATTVPTFLREMKAVQIPAYLLNTPEPADAINAVDATWSGALPATFLFNGQGQIVYKHTGRINPAELSAAIKKALE